MPKLTTILLTAACSFAGTIVGNGARVLTLAWLEHRSAAGSDGEPQEQQLMITAVFSNTVISTAAASAPPGRAPLNGFLIAAGLSAATGDMPDKEIVRLIGSMK